MGLKGKLSVEKEIKSHGDVFHDLFRHKPHDVASVTPNHVRGCDVHRGQPGTVGSVVDWDYSHEGKRQTIRVAIEAIDEDKKLVKYKVIGGEILELYKEYNFDIHMSDHVVTWTIEYEKVREDVPDPISYLDMAINVTNDVEAHHTT